MFSVSQATVSLSLDQMTSVLAECLPTVIPDVPDLAPNANRSMRARPDDPYVLPKRSPETRYDEQWQNI